MIPALSLSLSPASLPCLSLSCRSMRQSRLSLNDGIKMRGGTRDPPHRPSPCLVNAQRERDFSLSLWVKWWWHSDECLRVSLCSVCVCHSDVCVSLCSLSLCVCVWQCACACCIESLLISLRHMQNVPLTLTHRNKHRFDPSASSVDPLQSL